MDNRELELVWRLAKEDYMNYTNTSYEPQYWHMICIIKAFLHVHGREFPGMPVEFKEYRRQPYNVIDED